jgi:peptidoglycan/xylan/chitin deacetylase (PgdA/CDA1 family)
MRIPGVKTVERISRWAQARILGGALILGYHRVAEIKRDAYEVCVTPKHFAEQMDILSQIARPMSLSKLVQSLKAGSVPPKAVAVTFDDGYADNLYEVKPVLERYSIPATVFVCTGYAGKEFWWDELDGLVMSSQAELGALRLEVGKKSFVWRDLHVSHEAGPELRNKFRHALYHFLLALNVEEQSQAMEILRGWSGDMSSEIPARTMTREELVRLATGELLEIGAHTRFHPMLPRLQVEEQRAEIVGSKRELEDMLGRRVDGFAYPNGRATTHAKKIVREAGFVFACTSLHDVVRPASDLYELTRFWQTDVDGERFMRGLKLWM